MIYIKISPIFVSAKRKKTKAAKNIHINKTRIAMTSIINSTVPEFKVQAYHNGKFVTVTNEDLKGKWAIFFFYPADFTFVCPTELVDMVDK